MEISASVDLGQVARELNLPVESVERTVALLDEGNTVPFITRFRKDHTGGLDEEQIREIETRVAKLRMLSERKQTILKSIESQNKLTPALSDAIASAGSHKRLEDLYLPFKPKKQNLATAARERGLEPLAQEIFNQMPEAADLDARTAAFVDPDKGLSNPAEVLLGVGHLIAEQFSEHADLRGKLRRILWKTGKLVTSQVPPPEESKAEKKVDEAPEDTGPTSESLASKESESSPVTEVKPESASETQDSTARTDVLTTDEATAGNAPIDSTSAMPEPAEANPDGQSEPASTPDSAEQVNSTSADPAPNEAVEVTPALDVQPGDGTGNDTAEKSTPAAAEETSVAETGTSSSANTDSATTSTEGTEAPEEPKKPQTVKPAAKATKEKKKKKKKTKQDEAFKDYYDFSESLNRLPPHRTLAINRGERAKAIRVRIDCDEAAMQTEADQLLLTEGHAHFDFLKSCVRDSLSRLMVPSLEREARRELTEKAEDHAIEVFAQNLRKLLLQPPLRGRRVLAIDPGYRSGCKIAVVDPFGEVLDHATVHVVGREERRKSGRALLVGLIKKYKVSVVAIGNGAASREAEQLVSSVINEELKEFDVSFVIVNEAGASVYSTSPVGREEFPKYDPTVRSAISIARRLLDPLSELVKISPAHIGVGMYQHDVKSKHLKETLDAVVESCVNYVGVDCNTASPSLLKYVSGLNALHARRLYEHRQQQGPYRNRQELKKAQNIGDATFQQAAGFLKIIGSEHPLDFTWIHPESYDLAEKVLAKVGITLDDLKLNLTPEAEAFAFGGGAEWSSDQPAGQEPGTESQEKGKASQKPGETVTATSVASEQPPSSNESAADATSPQPEELDETTGNKTEEGTPVAELETQADATTDANAASVEASATDAEPKPVTDPAAPTTESGPSSDASESAAPSSEGDATAISTADSEGPAPESESGTTESNSSSAGDSASTTTTPIPPVPDPLAEAREAWENALAEQRAKFEAMAEKVSALNADGLAEELGVGKLSLSYLLKAITRPGRDPRDDLPQPVLRRGIMKLEDLQPGMELTGTVLNVVDFGAFVDIGLTDSGLVHISRLADRYVKDPHEVVSVGDVIKVWVMEVDPKRRRVSLTAIKPGTEKPKEERQRHRGRKKSEGGAKPGGSTPATGERKQTRRDRPQRKGKRGREQRPSEPRSYVLEAKPKESKPLKKKVIEGKEPMRSFSDLVQFYEQKDDEPGKKPDKK